MWFFHPDVEMTERILVTTTWHIFSFSLSPTQFPESWFPYRTSFGGLGLGGGLLCDVKSGIYQPSTSHASFRLLMP